MGSIKQTSAFERSQFIPPDAIFDVTRRYLADTDPNKVNLGQGTYRDENGQPWILPSVASCQSLSGTGALLLAGLALKKADTGIKTIYITDPTWSNHDLLFASMGFAVESLPYYKDRAFDFDGYIATLRAAEPGSAVILHACAHNPTGCDPSQEQWKQIAAVIIERGVFPVFDSAYLGFNSGNVDEDAWAIRYFVDELGLEAAVCMSFAKSMGLYGERIGAVTFVANSAETTRTVNSILENVQRATVSNPPAFGARIAAKVLGTPEIREQWAKDLITMSGRIRAMRKKVYDELVRLQTPGDWSHIVKQSGMFGYTGISKAQVQHLEEKYHVYMADTSRISIAGLNEKNVEYFAKALDDTVRSVA
uniref:Aspartate aminotransferase n=1 Tax=Colletotrichum fructicola (strain Nara gc5) TaxID=1213859 RepID=L2GG49_COLFN